MIDEEKNKDGMLWYQLKRAVPTGLFCKNHPDIELNRFTHPVSTNYDPLIHGELTSDGLQLSSMAFCKKCDMEGVYQRKQQSSAERRANEDFLNKSKYGKYSLLKTQSLVGKKSLWFARFNTFKANGLSVDENGVLSVTVDTAVTSVNGQTGDVEIDGTKIVVSPDDSRTVAEAIKESGGGTATEADKLSTARDLKVDLTSKLAQSFDGSEDATTIGVTGTLPLANGGTGNALGHATALTNQPLVDDTDLDTITEGSHYGSSQSFTNFPKGTTGKYFSLEVIRNSADTGYQRYHDMLTNREFIRSRSGNPSTFSEWVEITNQNNSTNAPLTDGTINSAATNPVLKYRILNDVIYISGSIDVVADGQTSGMQVKVGNIPTEYMPKKAVQGVGYIPIKCDYMGEGREKGSVIVVGDSQSSTSAQGAVMFYASTEGTEKLTSATWTFHGSYNLI